MTIDLHAELRASLLRRGITPPAKPYTPEQEPYRRPEPVPTDKKRPRRNKLTSPGDRARIRALYDAGVPLDEIHAEFPKLSRKYLRHVATKGGHGRRSKRLRCLRCHEPVGPDAELCDTCEAERQVWSRERRRRQREEAA